MASFNRKEIILAIGIFVVIAIILISGASFISAPDNAEQRSDISADIRPETALDETASDEAEEISGKSADKRLFMAEDEVSKFRIRPMFEEYQPVGVEIRVLRDDSILTKLGLLRNDIVKTFNGEAIHNLDGLTEALSEGVKAPRIDIEIIRNGEPLVVTYIVE